MISTMEKFINFKQLNVVKTGTSTANGSAALTLTDSAALFTQSILPNAIVWDRATNAGTGGEMYTVASVDSDTQLTLVAIGATASRGGGVPDATAYFIYMPENTVKQGGTADGTGAYQLIDTGVNFVTAGVQIGDSAYDITGGATALVTAVGVTTLTLDADIFVGGDVYMVYSKVADDHNSLMRSADLGFIENTGTNNLNSELKITYGDKSASQILLTYAFTSSTGSDEDMRNGVQNAVVASLQTPWPNVAFDFPGVLNKEVTAGNVNDGALAGQNFFILRFQKV